MPFLFLCLENLVCQMSSYCLSRSTPSCSVPWDINPHRLHQWTPFSSSFWLDLAKRHQQVGWRVQSEVGVFYSLAPYSGLLLAGFLSWPKAEVLSESPLHIPLDFFLSFPVDTTALLLFRSRSGNAIPVPTKWGLCGFSTFCLHLYK